MTRDTAKSLHDALVACQEITNFTAGATRASYEEDRGLQLIVERLLEILGEAINRVAHSDPELAENLPQFRDIIGLRNRIIHGYDEIDNELIWDVVVAHAPPLRDDIERLLAGME